MLEKDAGITTIVVFFPTSPEKENTFSLLYTEATELHVL